MHAHPLADWSTRDLLTLIGQMRDGDPEALRRSLGHVQAAVLTYDEAHDQHVLCNVFDDWSSEHYAVLRAAG